MPTKTFKDLQVKIDNAAGTITEITAFTSQASIEAAVEMLEDTGLNEEEKSVLPGLSGATVSLNGFVNSTTEGIFGPLVGNRTTVAKTFGIYNGLKWYNGETYPNSVQLSGNRGELPVWSVGLTFDGAVTRTSVAPA